MGELGRFRDSWNIFNNLVELVEFSPFSIPLLCHQGTKERSPGPEPNLLEILLLWVRTAALAGDHSRHHWPGGLERQQGRQVLPLESEARICRGRMLVQPLLEWNHPFLLRACSLGSNPQHDTFCLFGLHYSQCKGKALPRLSVKLRFQFSLP